MYGDRIQEIRISKPGRGFSKGSETTMYSLDDMKQKPVKEIISKAEDDDEEEDDESVDLFADDDEDEL